MSKRCERVCVRETFRQNGIAFGDNKYEEFQNKTKQEKFYS